MGSLHTLGMECHDLEKRLQDTASCLGTRANKHS